MDVLGLLSSAILGAGTGALGLILGGIGKAFTWYADRKDKEDEHKRVMELTRLNAEIRDKEFENEREIALDRAAADLRMSSYRHDSETGQASRWVVNTLRLVRPGLTGILVVLLGVIYFANTDFAAQQEIVSSVVYMATSAVTWWFGDRMTARRK